MKKETKRTDTTVIMCLLTIFGFAMGMTAGYFTKVDKTKQIRVEIYETEKAQAAIEKIYLDLCLAQTMIDHDLKLSSSPKAVRDHILNRTILNIGIVRAHKKALEMRLEEARYDKQ